MEKRCRRGRPGGHRSPGRLRTRTGDPRRVGIRDTHGHRRDPDADPDPHPVRDPGERRSQHPGVLLTAQHADGFVRPSPPNATTKLSCNWIQEEAAAVLIIVSTATDADVSTGLQQLASEGYQCQAAQDFGAQYCMRPGDAATSEDVVVARDDVWIYLETVNVNARAWLSDIAAQIYG